LGCPLRKEGVVLTPFNTRLKQIKLSLKNNFRNYEFRKLIE
jgi:hypothetical protein